MYGGDVDDKAKYAGCKVGVKYNTIMRIKHMIKAEISEFVKVVNESKIEEYKMAVRPSKTKL